MRLSEDRLGVAMGTLNWTSEMLADKCGVRVETVHHWLKGKKRVPGRMVSLIVAHLKQRELLNANTTSLGQDQAASG